MHLFGVDASLIADKYTVVYLENIADADTFVA
jgi:hypothetical protein